MASYQWEDNSEEIYKTAIALSPKPFRDMAKKSIDEALEKRLGTEGAVTEEMIMACIKEVTPKPFYLMGLKKLKVLLTKKG